MPETWNKRERERNKRQKKKVKMEKRQDKKHEKGKDWKDMVAYVDENGNLSSTPPERPHMD